MRTEAHAVGFDLLADAESTLGLTIATLAAVDTAGAPTIELVDGAIAARSLVVLDPTLVGRQVGVLFEANDPSRPVIIGVLQALPAPVQRSETPVHIEADGKRVEVTAVEEIVLRCGKASIQLLADGTVRIRGTNVVSRASAMNRIRGGSVEIN